MSIQVIIVRNFPIKDLPFLMYSRTAITCLTNNAYFPSLPVAPAALTPMADAYESAIQAARRGGGGTVEAREEKRFLLELALIQDQGYVSGQIALAPPGQQAAMQASSGFPAKQWSAHPKQAYAVANVEPAGNVLADLKAQGRHGTVMYCHQYSLTAGQTWISEAPTLDTKLLITGLPVGTTVWFQYRTLRKGVYGNWSQILTLAIH